MSDIELIRDAVRIIRERAEKATPNVCPAWIYQGVRHLVRNCDVECYHEPADGECTGQFWSRYDDHEHIALWQPSVALAVARLLDHTAEAYASDLERGDDSPEAIAAAYADELAVARLVLGQAVAS